MSACTQCCKGVVYFLFSISFPSGWIFFDNVPEDICDCLIHPPFTGCIRLQILHCCWSAFDSVLCQEFLEIPAKEFSSTLSCMHLNSLGYLESQQFANCSATCLLVLSLICMASTMFDNGSMHVKAQNSNSILLILFFHGPMRSTATVSHGNNPAIQVGSVHNFYCFVCSSGTRVGNGWHCRHMFSEACLLEILIWLYCVIFVGRNVLTPHDTKLGVGARVYLELKFSKRHHLLF